MTRISAKVFVVRPSGFLASLYEIGDHYTVGCVMRPIRFETYYAFASFI